MLQADDGRLHGGGGHVVWLVAKDSAVETAYVLFLGR